MRVSILALALLAPGFARAQGVEVKPELRPFLGTTIPVGDQRHIVDPGKMGGMQLAFQFGPSFHLVGSFAWMDAPSLSTSIADVGIAQYDVGLEINFLRPIGSHWSLVPFLGVGAGERRWSYEMAAALTPRFRVGDGENMITNVYAGHLHQSSTVSYVALGLELHFGPTALRLETRGNSYVYRSPDPAQDLKLRADLGVALGFAYHFH